MRKIQTYFFCVSFILLTIIAGYAITEEKEKNTSKFNQPGNTLIVNDLVYKGEVIEVSPSGNLVWRYRAKVLPHHPSGIFIQGDQSLISSAVRLSNGNTLITETRNHRVIEVNKEKQIVWSYGSDKGWFGNAPGYLACPYFAFPTRDGNVLITDTANNRILEVTRNHQIVWCLGFMNRWGFDIPPDYQKFFKLYYETPGYNLSLYKRDPYAFGWALPLKNGNILFWDYRKEAAFEITKNKNIVWSLKFSGPIIRYHDYQTTYLFPNYGHLRLLPECYFDFHHGSLFNIAAHFIGALSLQDNHFLLVDDEGVIFETDENGKIVWKYGEGEKDFHPFFVQRLGNVPLPLKK